MIASKEEKFDRNIIGCLIIQERPRMENEPNRIYLNLTQINKATHEKETYYLADFELEKKEEVLAWLKEPCRRRALRYTPALQIDRSLMLAGYKELFSNIVIM